ncbi:CehA/McbA family metallohydrolase [Vitiosangium sp. GDMCC 1.1324]|uniref:CehA/McbA family metallohydrolase n=1 Tax=Vitiosangium sp. (strain GDMCC 1.1324) TaxID=2138576 RepID=UPI000D3A27EB|nr:CehA/McbA family metallohydrolase [Vitiosangium sp. GDMCC 1.1324]PTL83399.1 hypothetical protein DAT35_15605 [Vitiosangium sp. GDMCC 1.1324]
MIREIHDHGGFPIIAHPYDDVDGNTTMRGQVLAEVLKTDLATRMPFSMEVINKEMEPQDRVSMTLWTQFLLQGARALPTFGRDAHSCNGENGADPVSDAGATVPYAKSLTMTGIVEALRAGRSYISTGAGVALWVRPVNPDPSMPHDPSDYRWMGSVVPLTLSGASRLWEVVVTVNAPVTRQLQVKVGRLGLSSETDLLNQTVSGTREIVIPLNVDRDLYVRAQLVDASGADKPINEAYSSPIWFDVPLP